MVGTEAWFARMEPGVGIHDPTAATNVDGKLPSLTKSVLSCTRPPTAWCHLPGGGAPCPTAPRASCVGPRWSSKVTELFAFACRDTMVNLLENATSLLKGSWGLPRYQSPQDGGAEGKKGRKDLMHCLRNNTYGPEVRNLFYTLFLRQVATCSRHQRSHILRTFCHALAHIRQ